MTASIVRNIRQAGPRVTNRIDATNRCRPIRDINPNIGLNMGGKNCGLYLSIFGNHSASAP